MSVEDHPAVDSLCPHGPDEANAVELVFVADSDFHDGNKAAIFDPEAIERGDDAWIQADEAAFVEVGPQ
jgi:hypothetical protein